ncbi:MAG: Hsp33 family molecular chaperone [Salaquimonas sp.]|nr:Hsp33 family molecular chaperone [Salaquimonas sp.]
MTDASPFAAIKFAGDDKVVPFEVSPLDIRGRAIQLGPMLNAILSRHDYPAPVATLLGEAVVLTVLLGTSLKFEGKFILQTQTDGPVSLLVADLRTPDAMRAYARFDAEAVAAAVAAGDASSEALLGNGFMAMTIDRGPRMQRYQGIVELTGASLEEVARQYFRQSEQIPTRVRLAVAEMITPGENGPESAWRAGGLMAQFLPEAPERMRLKDLPGGEHPMGIEAEDRFREDDAWLEAQSLVETIAVDELTDPAIGSERLLYRLFHEHGVRVFDGAKVADKCSCSHDKIVELIRAFPDDEREEAFEDDRIVSTCEFCNTVYEIGRDEL